ncbi:G2:M phase specific E3 ubiquitin protein ligase [Trichuris trichiura]|uniref:G2:M phase specific E3 ubiquitin protein ligase n=1 Tax=Trichuris trichiura TaxID=36087 RepID=A0A077Z5Y1_TRITR|nr:G2:M phase specific E3 ubiquitin protein ligase [Trichuris trichiura]
MATPSKVPQKANAGSPKQVCVFCKEDSSSEEGSGLLRRDADLQLYIHEFCMYFSETLVQGVDDTTPLMGFSGKAIVRLAEAFARKRCMYCKKGRATIPCSFCNRHFHFGCNRSSGGAFEFFGEYKAYCTNHVPQRMRCSSTPGLGTSCTICYEELNRLDNFTYMKPPCCDKNYMHRRCVQKMALESGAYYFACPVCRNCKVFHKAMVEAGIYVPTRDCSWNTDADYNELTQRPGFCSVSVCFCKNGRSHVGKGKLKLVFCFICGGSAAHKLCITGKRFYCSQCRDYSLCESKKFPGVISSDESTESEESECCGNNENTDSSAGLNGGIHGADEFSNEESVGGTLISADGSAPNAAATTDSATSQKRVSNLNPSEVAIFPDCDSPPPVLEPIIPQRDLTSNRKRTTSYDRSEESFDRFAPFVVRRVSKDARSDAKTPVNNSNQPTTSTNDFDPDEFGFTELIFGSPDSKYDEDAGSSASSSSKRTTISPFQMSILETLEKKKSIFDNIGISIMQRKHALDDYGSKSESAAPAKKAAGSHSSPTVGSPFVIKKVSARPQSAAKPVTLGTYDKSRKVFVLKLPRGFVESHKVPPKSGEPSTSSENNGNST